MPNLPPQGTRCRSALAAVGMCLKRGPTFPVEALGLCVGIVLGCEGRSLEPRADAGGGDGFKRDGSAADAGLDRDGVCPTALVSASLHSCALTIASGIWCWGRNESGQLGDGSTTERVVPTRVAGIASAVAVSAGGAHTCAILASHTLWCWGANDSGQLGDGTRGNRRIPTEAASLGSSVVEVSAGSGSTTCALKTDGTLWCWGRNKSGQIGDGTTVDRVMPVEVVALGKSVKRVAAHGLGHACALKTDNSLWCWGANYNGQLGDGTKVDRLVPVRVELGVPVTEVATGYARTCAVASDGSLRCWGEGPHGDGTANPEGPSPIEVAALGKSVAEVSLGVGHACARKTDGSLWCWGLNIYGQIGDGTKMDQLLPTRVDVRGVVSQSSGGNAHHCAITAEGRIRCWGDNEHGQLGDGTTTTRLVPTSVAGCP